MNTKEFGLQLCAAIGVNPERVTRIVLTVEVGMPVLVEVTRHADRFGADAITTRYRVEEAKDA